MVGDSRGWLMSYVDLIENVLFVRIDCKIALIAISVGCLGYYKFETLVEQYSLDILDTYCMPQRVGHHHVFSDMESCTAPVK